MTHTYRHVATLLVFFASFMSFYAQAPQKFSSQLLVRDASNELVVESQVGVRVSIIHFDPAGIAAYSETHAPTTNVNGLVSMEIGTGSDVTGSFSSIDWSNGPYFIKTEVDPTGGTDYTIDGTTELLSVPYALHAGSDDDWSVNGNDVYVPEGNNVGIGTDTPVAPLTVNGDALINGVIVGRGQNISFQNTVVGENAMQNNVISNGNTAIGYTALQSSDGFRNTAIGSFSLSSLQTGDLNTAIGTFTGNGLANGGGLTLIGASATASNDIFNSTAIGASAQVVQSNCLVLGQEGTKVGISANGAPNEMLEVGNSGRAFFGNGGGAARRGMLIVGGQSATVARIEAYDYGATAPMDIGLNTSGGDVGIRMNDPSVALDVNGSIEYTGTITDVSDERLKENFEPIEGAVESLTRIKGYTYNLKDDEEKVREYGVIAQEVQKVFPEMVTVVDEENGYLGMSYVQLIPVLLEAIKELKEENDTLKASNETQINENAHLNGSHALLQEKVKENNESIQELKDILNSMAKK